MERAQVSIELLFASLLLLSFFLLAANYASGFKQDADVRAARAHARVLANEISLVANAACAARANASFQLACPPTGFVHVAPDVNGSFNVSAGNAGFVGSRSSCKLNNSVSFSCAGSNWLCFSYSKDGIVLKEGTCG